MAQQVRACSNLPFAVDHGLLQVTTPGSSQTLGSPAPGTLTPSSGLCGLPYLCAYTNHHTHQIQSKINLSKNG